MTGEFIACELKEHQEIEGADRIVSSTIFGETVIVSKDTKVGTKGILVDCESVLSHELCHACNMYKHGHLNKDESKSGYIEDSGRVRPIKLKNVKCSALFIDESMLRAAGIPDVPEIGTQGNSINGIEICKKYINPNTLKAQQKNKGGKTRENLVPTFKEHVDTGHFARLSNSIREGNLVTITEKLHGTSFRCGNLKAKRIESIWFRIVVMIAYFFVHFRFKRWSQVGKVEDYKFVVGSRRTTKSIGGEETNNKQHYYDEDLWTGVCSRNFEGKLNKGEVIYGEIVGYTQSGQPIMGTHSNEKLKPFMSKKQYKEFIGKYSEYTVFDYGCTNKGVVPDRAGDCRNKVFVYRITRINEDGESIDLSWDQVKRRCEELGVSHVPELARLIYLEDDVKVLEELVDELTESDSQDFPAHLREGVVVRVDNGRNEPLFMKHKGYYFKVLEGIIKESDEVDIEESN